MFSLPGGQVKLAAGAEYYESALVSGPDPATRNRFDRDVTAFFGELLVPVFGSANSRPGLRRLVLSGSVRHEDYNDVGSTTNPKFGVLWSLIDGLDLRASYGTSFRAPQLRSLDETNNSIALFNLPDAASPTGVTTSLLLAGNNADLSNEEADTWTVGLEFRPPMLDGLEVNVTYYNIEFRNRITSAAGAGLTILDQDDRFSSAVTRNPGADLIEDVCNSDVVFSGIDRETCLSTPIGAIVDFRLLNSARTKTDGLDFSVRYGLDTGAWGRFDFELSGSYILSFQEAFGPGSPVSDLVDTVGNPVDLFMRNSVSWRSHAGLSLAAFVNYRDGYRDPLSNPQRDVDSWTTLDLTVAYNTEDRLQALGLGNTTFLVGVQNVLDADPPFVNNPIGVGYDPANATPQGRFVSVTMIKQW